MAEKDLKRLVPYLVSKWLTVCPWQRARSIQYCTNF